jgi:glutaredoxin 2
MGESVFDFLKPRRSGGGDGANLLANGSTLTLALYEYETCMFCQRVFSAIDRLKIQVEYRNVHQDGKWSADLRAKTGMSQVPCLAWQRSDGTAGLMHESLDIIAFLEREFRTAA